MTIVVQLFWGSVLLGVCSLVHMGLFVWSIKLLRLLGRSWQHVRGRLKMLRLMVVAFAIVVVAHTAQVWIWAVSFLLPGALSTLSDAIYFALVTYTTVGYGDVTVGSDYRIYGAMAAVTGLLNFGLSTAFLVGLFERMLPRRVSAPSDF